MSATDGEKREESKKKIKNTKKHQKPPKNIKKHKKHQKHPKNTKKTQKHQKSTKKHQKNTKEKQGFQMNCFRAVCICKGLAKEVLTGAETACHPSRGGRA